MSVNLVLLGAPGAGKGTQSKFIQEKFHIPQISTGDMLRKARDEKTELGKKADTFMKEGKLVPNEIVVGLIRERLLSPDTKSGFILDGFPRNLAQAKALDQVLHELKIVIGAVISLEVPEQELIQRLSGRRVCAQCGSGFHVQFSPPKNSGICDRCGGVLMQREDDSEETVKKRLKVYHDETAPLVDFYEREGVLKKIVGTGSQEEIFRKIASLIPKKSDSN